MCDVAETTPTPAPTEQITLTARHPLILNYADLVISGRNLGPLTMGDVGSLKVAELRALLAQRHLKTSGNKAALLERLLGEAVDVEAMRKKLCVDLMWSVRGSVLQYGINGRSRSRSKESPSL